MDEDVPRSSSPVLLEQDETTRWRFCSTLSHVSAGQGRASEANKATSAIKGSEVEVGARDNGLCDSLAMDTAEA